MKEFAKPFSKEGKCLKYLRDKFPAVKAKFKEGVFMRCGVCKLLNNLRFKHKLA